MNFSLHKTIPKVIVYIKASLSFHCSWAEEPSMRQEYLAESYANIISWHNWTKYSVNQTWYSNFKSVPNSVC